LRQKNFQSAKVGRGALTFESVTGYNSAAYFSTFGFVKYPIKSSTEYSSPRKLGWRSPSARPLGAF